MSIIILVLVTLIIFTWPLWLIPIVKKKDLKPKSIEVDKRLVAKEILTLEIRNDKHTNTQHRIWQLFYALLLQLVGLSLVIPLPYFLFSHGVWYWAVVTIPIGCFVSWYGFHWTNARRGGEGYERDENYKGLMTFGLCNFSLCFPSLVSQ